MRWVAGIGLLVSAAACDGVFGLSRVKDSVDGAIVSPSFDAPSLDTAGWPTDGGVGRNNCTSTHDEDGDTVVDDCDNCPADQNLDQSDSDRDGIGDPCDPHPMFAVERLARFFAFDTATAPGSRIGTVGSWVVVSDVLRQQGTTTGRAAFVLEGGPWREPTVEVKMANIKHNGTSVYWHIGVVLANDAMPTDPIGDQINCRSRVSSSGPVNLEMVRIRAGTQVLATNTPFQMQAPGISTVAVTAAQHGDTPRCSGARANLPPIDLPDHLVLYTDVTDAINPSVELFTLAAQADFLSVVIYETIWP